MRRPSPQSDAGSALLVAIMGVGVCLAVSLVGISMALSATRSSGVDRQRVLAIHAAEAGVDSAYAAISGGGASPPCGLPATNARSGPDAAVFTTTIAYRDKDGNALGCISGAVTGIPTSALIRSTAVTNTLAGASTRGERTMEALVDLMPVQQFNKAIFADAAITFDNHSTLTGNVGADADIYSNTSLSCQNNTNIAGNAYSQGDLVISNSCSYGAGVWAAGSITGTNSSSGTIAGFARAGSGTIALPKMTVSGSLAAAGAITYGGCGPVGKCFPNSTPGPPPAMPFPVIRGDAASLAGWTASAPTGGGYTVYTETDCANLTNLILTVYTRKGSPTLLSTPCAVAFNGNKDTTLYNNLAIFAAGGFSSSGQTSFRSDSAVNRLMHWIVPYVPETRSRPCASPGVSTSQQFSLDDNVDMFLYSPCNIAFANNSTHVGQIYGGSNVAINNRFELAHRPVPTFGVDMSSVTAQSYTPSIVYKRETR